MKPVWLSTQVCLGCLWIGVKPSKKGASQCPALTFNFNSLLADSSANRNCDIRLSDCIRTVRFVPAAARGLITHHSSSCIRVTISSATAASERRKDAASANLQQQLNISRQWIEVIVKQWRHYSMRRIVSLQRRASISKCGTFSLSILRSQSIELSKCCSPLERCTTFNALLPTNGPWIIGSTSIFQIASQNPF